jgi:hypothetical protein
VLVEQYAISDGQITPPVGEGAKQTQSLSRPIPSLVEESRPANTCVKVYSKVPC